MTTLYFVAFSTSFASATVLSLSGPKSLACIPFAYGIAVIPSSILSGMLLMTVQISIRLHGNAQKSSYFLKVIFLNGLEVAHG